MNTLFINYLFTIALILISSTAPSSAEYLLQSLTKEEAIKAGMTVKSRPNGDAGTKVWLEVSDDCTFGKVAGVEIRMTDTDGKELMFAWLKPHPVTNDQPKNLTTYSFSTTPSQLDSYSFIIFNEELLLKQIAFIIKITDHLDI